MGNNNSTHEGKTSTRQEDTEYEDLSLMLPTLELLVAQLDQNQSVLRNLLEDLQYEDKLEKHRNTRTPEKRRGKRKTFTEITHELTDIEFRRMFRMTRQAFTKLCKKVGDSVGDNIFKSEHKTRPVTKTTKATLFRGGEVSGEVRLATYLRLMAGASYLDLFMIYDIKKKQIYSSFNKVAEWINNTFTLPLVKALQEKDEAFFEELSKAFSRDSNGVYIGCIGALDGLAVKIKRPIVSKKLPNPGAYYCRKGFYALNCQAICDVNKRLLWISSRHIGSCHDSRAFTDTRLYSLLLERKEWLKERGFFIVGDSAYNLESFLLIPYEQPAPKSSEDAYNFWQSNSRIRIECCFGEVSNFSTILLIYTCCGCGSSSSSKF
jgi:hypothetical protein